MLEEIKNIKSSKQDLRSFSYVIGGAFVLIGLWQIFHHRPSSLWLILGVFVAALGLLAPSVLKPFQKIWMAFAVVMGWFMTKIILFLVFIFVFTSISLLAKVLKKRFLDLNQEKNKKSYWEPHESSSSPIDLEKQF